MSALPLVLTGAACALFAAPHGSGQAVAQAAEPRRELRVCADPNNMPFSNRRLEGFENKLAAMLAKDLGAAVKYTWWPQRRGFFRNTLKEGACDVVMGVPANFEMVRATRPYYRSSYVFVSRKGRGLAIRSFDDPALRSLAIGVQIVGDDCVNMPPAHALGRRGIVANVTGYSLYGDYSKESPTAAIVSAVEFGAIDVAVVWGPLAGYFAKSQGSALEIHPASPQADGVLPLAFDISMGVRKGETSLHEELEAFLERRRPEINRLLDEYGVPRTQE